MLKPEEIVRSPTMSAHCPVFRREPGVDLAAGKKIFADNCAACHGEDGKGNQRSWRAQPHRQIWLYGPDEATIIETSPTAAAA